MMIIMMASMGHMSESDQSAHQHGAVSDTTPDLRGLSHDEQVHALRSELTKLAWRQETLRQDLEHLEPERVANAEPAAPRQ
jgi:hypothetical protein